MFSLWLEVKVRLVEGAGSGTSGSSPPHMLHRIVPAVKRAVGSVSIAHSLQRKISDQLHNGCFVRLASSAQHSGRVFRYHLVTSRTGAKVLRGLDFQRTQSSENWAFRSMYQRTQSPEHEVL